MVFELRDAKKNTVGKTKISIQEFFRGKHDLFRHLVEVQCTVVLAKSNSSIRKQSSLQKKPNWPRPVTVIN